MGHNFTTKPHSNRRRMAFQRVQIIIIQPKKRGSTKTKIAAQLLGYGELIAFTAYKPQPIRPSPKKSLVQLKRISIKEIRFSVSKGKYCLFSLTQKQGPCSFNSKLETDQQKAAMHTFIENVSTLNKCELLKIFNPRPPKQQEVAKSSSLTDFIGLLLEYMLKQFQGNLKQLQQKQFSQIVNYLSKFVLGHLPSQIIRYRIEGYPLFKEMNSIKFILSLQNWFDNLKTQAEEFYIQNSPGGLQKLNYSKTFQITKKYIEKSTTFYKSWLKMEKWMKFIRSLEEWGKPEMQGSSCLTT